MPSTSPKQHRFMLAIAHGMKPHKGGPSPAIAREYVQADKGKHFSMRPIMKHRH